MGLNQPLRWGLWGTGRISHHVAQDLALLPGAQITRVGGRRLPAAQQLAAAHAGASAVDSLDLLIACDQVDAIYIATPDGCHLDDARKALLAGKPVVCEKPLAASLADVHALIDTARQQRVFLMEAMWMRFLPAVVEIKRRVDTGEIGPIRFMQGSFSYPDVRRDQGPYASAAHAVLYDRGIYLIALAQLLVGGEFTQPQAQGMLWGENPKRRSLCRFDVRIGDKAWLSGVCGNGGELSNRFEVIGERGTISLAGPFFKPHAFVLQHLDDAPAQAGTALSSNNVTSSSWVASAKQLKRRFQWLFDAARAARQPQLNFKGNGYQFQFAQANRCIAEGRQECPNMTWADSVALSRALQTVADAMVSIHDE